MKFLSKERLSEGFLLKKGIALALCFIFLIPLVIFADENRPVRPVPVAETPADSIPSAEPLSDENRIEEEIVPTAMPADSLAMIAAADSVAARQTDRQFKKELFTPDPTRAVWMSALCPGLGQIYNRRYWKVPIVVGGYVGLVYATSWNNRMLSDYTKAYSDIRDSDPNTKSYMDFYPPNTKEEDIDMEWLERSLKSKKDFFRRNRDLCIIGMVGLYFLCMVDAYVDASLMHFDISPNLSMDVAPSMLEPANSLSSVGVSCAFTF